MILQEMDNYAGSNVLILGGGDGGVLKELLQLQRPPKNVTMIELDDAVMIGCAKHMKSVCGDFLNEGLYEIHINILGIPLLPYQPKVELRTGKKQAFKK